MDNIFLALDFRTLFLECTRLLVNFHYRACNFQQLFSKKKVARKPATPTPSSGYFSNGALSNLLPKNMKEKTVTTCTRSSGYFYKGCVVSTTEIHGILLFLLFEWQMKNELMFS